MLFESIRNDIDELYLARDEAGKREQLHELVGSCDRNRFVMMLYSLSLSMPEVKELVAEERALLFNALASRLKRGAKAVPNPEKSAASLLFFFESAIMQSALFDQAPAEDLLMEVLVDQFLSLCDAERPPAEVPPAVFSRYQASFAVSPAASRRSPRSS